MAYTVDWTSRVVTVPQSDLTLVQSAGSSTLAVYELDLAAFWHEVRRLEAEAPGVPNPPIVDNTPPAAVDSATTLARVVRIINGYRVRFDDGSGAYVVRLSGANTNIADTSVLWPNSVSVLASNTAGLVSIGGGVSADVRAVGGVPVSGPDDLKTDPAQVWARVLEGSLSAEAAMRIILAVLAGKVDGAGTGTEQFYSQDGTKVRVRSHVDAHGNRSSVQVDGS